MQETAGKQNVGDSAKAYMEERGMVEVSSSGRGHRR